MLLSLAGAGGMGLGPGAAGRAVGWNLDLGGAEPEWGAGRQAVQESTVVKEVVVPTSDWKRGVDSFGRVKREWLKWLAIDETNLGLMRAMRGLLVDAQNPFVTLALDPVVGLQLKVKGLFDSCQDKLEDAAGYGYSILQFVRTMEEDFYAFCLTLCTATRSGEDLVEQWRTAIDARVETGAWVQMTQRAIGEMGSPWEEGY